jgi:hypothetical protein
MRPIRFEACFEACQTVNLTHILCRKEKNMKTKLTQILMVVSKINRQHVQLALALLAIVLFVLGAGAPDGGGVVGR